jgi:20S proteasome alpha/beta subunit
MTIAIGLISRSKASQSQEGQIVLASDSQTTYPGGQKRVDTQKVSIVDFLDARILVAQAGSAELADKAVEILRRNANSVKVEDNETIPKLVQASVREVRNHLIELNRGCNFSEDGWKRYFRDENAFTLLFGYYCQGEPYLYTVNIDWGLAIPVKTSFKAIGCGAMLGEFLLKEYSEAFPDFAYSDVIATAVVEKVIENVEGCGRPTWVGITYPVSDSRACGMPGYEDGAIVPASKRCEAFICRRELTDSIANALGQQEKTSQSKKAKQLFHTLASLCKRLGGLVYTDYGDKDGGGAFRFSMHAKSEKDRKIILEKASKRRGGSGTGPAQNHGG